ncbi:AFG1/ZapE family ATPase, partial [Klebsiella aerogenes]|uniref:AFG1/ZapE family ATPase n=1 Tax=Klebsiella aerogenes TaxID=548 RepID=UPI0013D6DABD
PLGASDYLALVSSIHTLILEDIPVMGEENRNEAKRFITLVDTLYEARVKLLASAAADAPDLYKARDGRGG